MLESVSPCLTVTFRSDFKPVTLAGTTISVPAAMRVGSTMPGLAASSCCQREPRPRFSCATFQRESPRCIVTVCCEEVFANVDGCTIAAGAFGCEIAGSIAGAIWARETGGAIAASIFGLGTCGTDGAMREVDGGAGGAVRRAKGSSRRKGPGFGIVGATTVLGRAGTRFGCAGVKLGRGGVTFGNATEGSRWPKCARFEIAGAATAAGCAGTTFG